MPAETRLRAGTSAGDPPARAVDGEHAGGVRRAGRLRGRTATRAITVAKRHRLVLIGIAPDNLKDWLVRVMRGLVVEQCQRLPGDVQRLRGLREHGEIVALKLSQLLVESLQGLAAPPVPDDSAQLDQQNVDVIPPVPSPSRSVMPAFRQSRQRAYRAGKLAGCRHAGATDQERHDGGLAPERRLDFVSEDVAPLGQPRVVEPVGSDEHQHGVCGGECLANRRWPGLAGGDVVDVPPDEAATEAENQRIGEAIGPMPDYPSAGS